MASRPCGLTYSPVNTWKYLNNGAGQEENNNVKQGTPDCLNLSGYLTPNKWSDGDLRPRASPIMDAPSEGLPMSDDIPEIAGLSRGRHRFTYGSWKEGLWRRDRNITYQMLCRTLLWICVIIALFQIALIAFLQTGTNFSPFSVNGAAGDPYISRGCASGHIQDFSPACTIQECLELLSIDPAERVNLPRPDPFTEDLRNEISHIPGQMNSVHMDIVSALTDMQWHHNIYGSVGEVGVQFGKFTSVLAHNYHQGGGERIFVSDVFSKSPMVGPANAPMSQYDMFHEVMKHRGFSFDSSAGPSAKHLYMHDGPQTDLARNLLVDWNMPQFRMFSISNVRSTMEFFDLLEICTCVLRDGGILVIEGVSSQAKRGLIIPVLHKYFRIHGTSAITPLLSAQNKLYLCTSNWKNKYTAYLQKQTSFLHSLSIDKVTDEEFRSTFTYLKARS